MLSIDPGTNLGFIPGHAIGMSVAQSNPQGGDPETTMSAGLPALPSECQDESPDSSPPTVPEFLSTTSKAKIGYRTEYRHLTTNEMIMEEVSETPQTNISSTSHGQELVFEVVKTYWYIPGKSNMDNVNAIHNVEEPFYTIKLHSPAIINALRAVVQYYPGAHLDNEIIIQSPYCILVHHYDELQEYANERSATLPEHLCVRDRFVGEHMKVLIQFLDETVMKGVRVELERNARGCYTFDHAWLMCKPGKTLIANFRSDKNWRAQVISSVTGGSFVSQPGPWIISSWSLDYDGRYLSRKLSTTTISRFDGEHPFAGWKLMDTSEVEDSKDPVIRNLVEWGRIYCELLGKKCMHHKGQSLSAPFQQKKVQGLVMADADLALSYKPQQDFMSSDDLDQKGWRCECSVCHSTQTDGNGNAQSPFACYDKIASQHWEEGNMTAHHYILCPFEVIVFVFKTRTWVHIQNLRDPEFDETMVNSLIIDKAKKRTLTSLAKSFARRNKTNEEIIKPMWSADFVAGKGAGSTFLLHGKPGVGKTLTAECIAAFTKRPLMILTSSDIGVDADEVEQNLSKHFKNAKSWGAVLLIDEADVFMERRSTADLHRNSLVAGFLRALEYYEGILFLTTNRVGSFDDAFISRIHVQLYYPEFTDDQRQLVWKTFIDKLERERKGYMRLSISAKEYIKESKKSNLKWNGREIRNVDATTDPLSHNSAFQTAVSLAEYDAEKDEEGTILVTDEHLRAVVELSTDFKDYLKDLHMGDEDKRAEQRSERLNK
ncbi:P-loop containing nucleoside triphosphate hydrolase protein [Apiospora arundinis]